MSYIMKNGILHENGVPKLALGSSYYPSFHPAKFPVPPEGDRLGEMKKDLKQMQEMGFQFLRTAALGDVFLEGDKVRTETPFIDAMAKECEKRNIALSVRLNGYISNLRGNTDYRMVNHKGEEAEKIWSVFLEFCLHHEGILRDNADATKALAEHFDRFPAIVSYQIYNEPHYPFNGAFDYHPLALAAYRKWLVEKGYMAKEDAVDYTPPAEKPTDITGIEEWIRFRIFSMNSMSDFLNQTSAYAKEAAPTKETYTCYTSSETGNERVSLGISYFDDDMDVVGLTNYINLEGSDIYSSLYTLDVTACAAELKGKHAWMIEADARVKAPARKLYAQTYMILGAGFKGICYYAWKGDYPYEGTPIPDNCGFYHYDGTPSLELEEKKKLFPMLNRYSTQLVLSERMHSGIAILHSDYGFAYGEAVSNIKAKGVNPWQKESIRIYAELIREGHMVDFVQSKHLNNSPFPVSVLFVPFLEYLSSEEKEQLNDFSKQGGKIYCSDHQVTFTNVNVFGYRDYTKPKKSALTDEFGGALEMADVLEENNLIPLVSTNHRNLFYKLTKADDGYFLFVINNSPSHKVITNHAITISLPFKKALLITPEGDNELTVNGKEIILPEINYGAIIKLYK